MLVARGRFLGEPAALRVAVGKMALIVHDPMRVAIACVARKSVKGNGEWGTERRMGLSRWVRDGGVEKLVRMGAAPVRMAVPLVLVG